MRDTIVQRAEERRIFVHCDHCQSMNVRTQPSPLGYFKFLPILNWSIYSFCSSKLGGTETYWGRMTYTGLHLNYHMQVLASSVWITWFDRQIKLSASHGIWTSVPLFQLDTSLDTIWKQNTAVLYSCYIDTCHRRKILIAHELLNMATDACLSLNPSSQSRVLKERIGLSALGLRRCFESWNIIFPISESYQSWTWGRSVGITTMMIWLWDCNNTGIFPNLLIHVADND